MARLVGGAESLPPLPGGGRYTHVRRSVRLESADDPIVELDRLMNS